ncbi:hypothetical protein AGABI1DRAFT_116275, partial [Agaricus bisporus var. burnettii JB137-S8]
PTADPADQLAGPCGSSPITPTPPIPTTKRGRGRPKGSKNKKKGGSCTNEEEPGLSCQGPGRPRGSGHRQAAQASHSQSVGSKTFPPAVTVVEPQTLPATKPTPHPIANNTATHSSTSNSSRLPEHEHNTESAKFITGTAKSSQTSPLSTIPATSPTQLSGSLQAAP